MSIQAEITTLLRSQAHRWLPGLSRWAGVRHELAFWDEWILYRGLSWNSDYVSRLDPNTPLQDSYRHFVDDMEVSRVRILDVGSGPLTHLGKVHPTKRLEITAVDPLAEAYDAILSKHGVMPLVRTQHAVAERLVEYFSPGSFDLVTARNCLDHASDPLEAIRQILLTTRKGGVAVLEHVENEGEKEGYKGMHAWNFFVENNRLLVRGRGERVDISETLSRLGDFHAMSDGGWVNAWIRRT